MAAHDANSGSGPIPGVLILVLGDPLARRSAVCRKSVVFSSLPTRKGLILTFRAVFLQRGYPQSKPCLLLVLYYLFL